MAKMSRGRLRARVVILQRRIAESYQELAKLQELCDHPKDALTEKYDSNTGNYDPSADAYWVDRHCGECDKRWRRYSDEEGYR